MVLAGEYELGEALRCFRGTRAVLRRLAQVNPGNTGSRQDLSITGQKIGDVPVARGDPTAALAPYIPSNATDEILARAYPEHGRGARCLAASNVKVAEGAEIRDSVDVA